MVTGQVDSELQTWVSRWWGKKAGQIITEIAIGHCKSTGGAPVPVQVIPKERLEGFKDSRELCQDLEEIVTEHARIYAGMVRFEIVMWAGVRPVATKQIKRMGEGEPDNEDVDISTRGLLGTYVHEHRKMFDSATGVLIRANEDLERRLQKANDLIDRLYAKYPELLDLMEGLADRSMERAIKMRQVSRVEDIKDKAGKTIMTFLPHLLAKWSEGTAIEDETKMLAAAPHLKAIIKSMSGDEGRFMQILALMNEQERKHFLLISQAYDAQEEEEKKQKANQSEIKVKEGVAQATPPNGGAE